MTRENAEVVRRIYEGGLSDGDPARFLDAFAVSEIEYVNPPEAVEPGTRRGRIEVAQALRNTSEPFDSSRHELHEKAMSQENVEAR